MDRCETIIKLSKNPLNIRNFCLLAHVDHGKTTFADHLVASNGIIMTRTAGKLRYMDNKKEEQDRGITIKSSVISLLHYNPEAFLINLIDSPGHIDFNNEVSAAIRLCDGGVILVDVIEGMCPQTQTVIKQAFEEDIKIILTFNKMDRLITELKLTALEAYTHLLKLLDEINSFLSELIASKALNEEVLINVESCDDLSENIYFSPCKGNVLFASALDGWCFNLSTFANIYSKKLGLSKISLRKTLWGDFYINSKEQKIYKGALGKKKIPLFVTLILNNIWNMYTIILTENNKDNILKIFASLNLKQPTKDIMSYDSRFLLSNIIFQQWLPITTIFLDTICNSIPNPINISNRRLDRLFNRNVEPIKDEALPFDLNLYQQYFTQLEDPSDTPLIAFVSKIFKVNNKILTKNTSKTELLYNNKEISREKSVVGKNGITKTLEDRKLYLRNLNSALLKESEGESDGKNSSQPTKETIEGVSLVNGHLEDPLHEVKEDVQGPTLLALCRIFAGTLSCCDTQHPLYMINPSKNSPSRHVKPVKVKHIYLMTGGFDDMIPVLSAGKGNVVAVELVVLSGDNNNDNNLLTTTFGLICLKYFTLASDPECPCFSGLSRYAEPLISVALEPKKVALFSLLHKALQMLVQSDPSAQFRLDDKGQLLLMVVGEVHLEHCLLEITEMFPELEFTISEPIVPFRETITSNSLLAKRIYVHRPTEDYFVSNGKADDETEGEKVDKIIPILNEMGILLTALNNDPEINKNMVTFDIEALPIPTSLVKWFVDQKATLKLESDPEAMMEGLQRESSKTMLANLFDVCKSECHCKKLDKKQTDHVEYYHSDSDECPDEVINDAASLHSSAAASSSKPCTTNKSSDLNPALRHRKINLRQGVTPFASKRYYRRVRRHRFCWCALLPASDPSVPLSFATTALNERIWCTIFPGDVNSPNLLINSLPFFFNRSRSDETLNASDGAPSGHHGNLISLVSKHIESSLKSAFVSLSTAGPLAEEPLYGVCFNVRDILVNLINGPPREDGSPKSVSMISLSSLADRCEKNSFAQTSHASPGDRDALDWCLNFVQQSLSSDSPLTTDDVTFAQNDGRLKSITNTSHGLVSGRILLAAQHAMRASFLDAEPRLALAMYACSIQSKIDALGKMYSVLNKRYGRVMSEHAHEGTQLFTVEALLPVVESFGFTQELRTKTSGLANPLLHFSHWEVLDENPCPKDKMNPISEGNSNPSATQLGGKQSGDRSEGSDEDDFNQLNKKNRAENYLYTIRKRKGLPTLDKLVPKAEKQRTLTKNK